MAVGNADGDRAPGRPRSLARIAAVTTLAGLAAVPAVLFERATGLAVPPPLREAVLPVVAAGGAVLVLSVADRGSLRGGTLRRGGSLGLACVGLLIAGAGLLSIVVATDGGLVLRASATVFAFTLVYDAVLHAGNVVYEEVIVRGYLMRALIAPAGVRGALVVSSAAFALLHVPAEGFALLRLAQLLAVGFALGLAYLRFGGLWAPMSLHWGFNMGADTGGRLLAADPAPGAFADWPMYVVTTELFVVVALALRRVDGPGARPP
jgi:membrane protease YdiL (CAAX protease family)